MALNAHWRRYPPAAVQLLRIARFIGLPEVEVIESPAPRDVRGDTITEQDMAALAQMLPTVPMQPFQTAEEYLRNKHQGMRDGQ